MAKFTDKQNNLVRVYVRGKFLDESQIPELEQAYFSAKNPEELGAFIKTFCENKKKRVKDPLVTLNDVNPAPDTFVDRPVLKSYVGGSKGVTELKVETIDSGVEIEMPVENIQVDSLEQLSVDEWIKLVNSSGSRFHDLKFLAQGGMGAVVKAKDYHDRNVALKLILPPKDGDAQKYEKAKRRFNIETKYTAQLDHPNIITLYESGNLEGKTYYAMKFVESGKDLKKLIASKEEHSVNDLLRMIEKVCDAMSFAHERSIIHRDLKPENVMLDKFGQVYVADWGLAKNLKSKCDDALDNPIDSELSENVECSLSLPGGIMGSPPYWAPEQANPDLEINGKKFSADARTDVYLTGAVMYELLSGKKFRHADNVYAFIAKAVENKFEKPRKLNKIITPEIESIILKALATNPDERYQSMQEFGDDIRNYIEGKEVVAHHYTKLELNQRWIKEHIVEYTAAQAKKQMKKTAMWIGGVGLTALLGIGAFIYNSLENSRLDSEAKAEKQKSIAAQAKKDKDAQEKIAKLQTELYEKTQVKLDAKVEAEEAQKKKDAQTKDLVWKAEEQIKIGEYDKAIDILNKANKIDDRNVDVYYNLGQAYHNKIMADKAIECYDKANKTLESLIGKPEARSTWGKIMTQIDHLTRMNLAAETAKNFLKKYPDKDAYFNLMNSIVAFDKKDFKRAIAEVEEAKKKDPKFAMAYYLSASYKIDGCARGPPFDDNGLRFNRNYEKALDEIQKAIQLDPNVYRFFMEETEILVGLERYDDAVEKLDKLIIRNPNQVWNYVLKAHVLLSNDKIVNNLQECIKYVDTILPKMRSPPHNMYLIRGQANFRLDNLEEALKDCKKSFEITPNVLTAHMLGSIYYTQRKFDDALREAENGIKLDPNYGGCYVIRGSVYEKMKKDELALADYNKAIELGHNNANYDLGMFYYNKYKDKEALPYFEKYLQSDDKQHIKQVKELIADIKKNKK